jgi:hypothetical protein
MNQGPHQTNGFACHKLNSPQPLFWAPEALHPSPFPRIYSDFERHYKRCAIWGLRGGDWKNAVVWDVTPRGSRKNQCFGGTYRLHHSIIRVTRIGGIGTMLAVTSKQSAANVVPSSQIIVALMMEVIRSSDMSVLIRATRRNIQKTTFFITKYVSGVYIAVLSRPLLMDVQNDPISFPLRSSSDSDNKEHISFAVSSRTGAASCSITSDITCGTITIKRLASRPSQIPALPRTAASRARCWLSDRGHLVQQPECGLIGAISFVACKGHFPFSE